MIPKKKKAATKKATSKPKAAKKTVAKVEEVKEEEYIPKRIQIQIWKKDPRNDTNEHNPWIDQRIGSLVWSDIKQEILETKDGHPKKIAQLLRNGLPMPHGQPAINSTTNPRGWVANASQALFPDGYYAIDISETVDEA